MRSTPYCQRMGYPAQYALQLLGVTAHCLPLLLYRSSKHVLLQALDQHNHTTARLWRTSDAPGRWQVNICIYTSASCSSAARMSATRETAHCIPIPCTRRSARTPASITAGNSGQCTVLTTTHQYPHSYSSSPSIRPPNSPLKVLHSAPWHGQHPAQRSLHRAPRLQATAACPIQFPQQHTASHPVLPSAPWHGQHPAQQSLHRAPRLQAAAAYPIQFHQQHTASHPVLPSAPWHGRHPA
jgi:hypothetical protein